MAEVVVLPARLANGALIQIEARNLDAGGLVQDSGDRDATDRDADDGGSRSVSSITTSLEGALSGVEALATDISEMLRRVSPDEATVEFDVELAAESGRLTSLIVKGSGRANFRITLSWKRPPTAPR